MKTQVRRLAVAALVPFALAAGISSCGGGGGGAGGGPPPPAPLNLVYSSAERLEISQVDIEPITAVVNGVVDQFTIVPPLPAGIVLDAATGTISGAAIEPAPRTVYDVAASNAGGSAHFALTLEVVPAPRFLYATSSTDRSISLYAGEIESGEITRAGQTLTSATETEPERIVFHPSGRFAYVPDMDTNNVTAFMVDPDTGWLDAQGSVPVADGPHAMAIHPSGEFAYVVSRGTDVLHQFTIDPVTGVLTQLGGPIATSIQPSDIDIDPSGHLLFITLRGRDTDGLGSAVQGFTVDPVSGFLTATWPSQFLLGGRPSSLDIDPLKPVMYVTLEWFSSALPIRFDPVTGEMTPVALRHAGVLPMSVAAHVSGRYAYLVSQGDDTVRSYTVDPVTSSLELLATYATGSAPTSLELDPSGRFAYVAARDSGEIITYTIDAATGALAEHARMRTRGAPCDVALGTGDRPTQKIPRFVHVAGRASGDVTSYTIDAATGALTQTSVTPTGARPSSIAVDPLRRYAWVANEDAGTISIRSLNPVTGALGGAMLDLVVAGKPVDLVVDPTARFVYSVARDVLVPEDGWLSAWTIGANGALSVIGSVEIGANPTAVVIDPTGRFLYAANRGTAAPSTGGIRVFSIDVATGSLVPAGSSVIVQGVADLVFHPHGYEACALVPAGDALVRYTVDAGDGHLVLVPPFAPAGPEPVGLAFSPFGRFAYVASRGAGGAGNLALHPVAGVGEVGAAMQTVVDGTQPTAVGVDPTGGFAFAVNAGSDTVSVARLDRVTGEMTLGVPVGTGVEPGAIAVTGITQ